MLRRLSELFLFALLPASAQIWPEQWREHKRIKVEPATSADAALFAEYGGETGERAVYAGPAGKFTATAFRLSDSTGALALFESTRPEDATPLRGSLLGSTTPGTMTVAYQNYLLSFEGWRPTAAEFRELWSRLPALRSGGGLPILAGYLPEKDRIRNSERYIVGPEGLARAMPDFPTILAGFEQGAEAQLGRFRVAEGEHTLLIFSYPTPHIARERLKEFEKQSGWVVRRSGSYVAVVPKALNSTRAAGLLEGISYNQNFIWNEATKPVPPPNVGLMLVAIFELTGLLLVICVGGGLLLALLWIYLRKRDARVGPGTSMISLHLEDR